MTTDDQLSLPLMYQGDGHAPSLDAFWQAIRRGHELLEAQRVALAHVRELLEGKDA